MRLDAKVLRILAMSSAGILIVALCSILSFAAQSEPIPKFETLKISTEVGGTLSWAWPDFDRNPPARKEDPGPRSMPGSTRTYLLEQALSPTEPPDWFPDEHPPAPEIVLHAKGVAWACGSCHLMSGLGHPEHSDLTGFTSEYLIQQTLDFKSGARKDGAERMNEIAGPLSEEDIRQASEWFAKLTPRVWTKVTEVTTVPKTYTLDTRMRVVHPDGGTEPLGNRIVTLPEDEFRARNRDPHSGYMTYVPVGSIAKGEALVKNRGCAICHGDALEGIADIPRIAGTHAIYIVRQLRDFQTGARNGRDAALMKAAVANLTDEDIVAIAAYLAAQPPPLAPGDKR